MQIWFVCKCSTLQCCPKPSYHTQPLRLFTPTCNREWLMKRARGQGAGNTAATCCRFFLLFPSSWHFYARMINYAILPSVLLLSWFCEGPSAPFSEDASHLPLLGGFVADAIMYPLGLLRHINQHLASRSRTLHRDTYSIVMHAISGLQSGRGRH